MGRQNPLHPKTPEAPPWDEKATAEGVYITYDRSIAESYAQVAADDDGTIPLVIEIDVEGLRKHPDPQAIDLLYGPYMAYRQDVVNYILSEYSSQVRYLTNKRLDERCVPWGLRASHGSAYKSARKAARRALGPVYDYIIKRVIDPNLWLRPVIPQYFNDPAHIGNEKQAVAKLIFDVDSSWDLLRSLHDFYGDRAPGIILQWLDLQLDREEPMFSGNSVYVRGYTSALYQPPGSSDIQFHPEFWYYISRFAYIDEIIPDERITRILDLSSSPAVDRHPNLFSGPAKEPAYHGTSSGRVKDALSNL